jgi:hypothetical protein
MEKVRAADLPGLETMLRNHSHKNGLRWKRIAIRRAISRFLPSTQEWIHSLEELDKDLPHMKSYKVQLICEAKERFAVLSRL